MKYHATSEKKVADVATLRQGHLFRKGIKNLPIGEVFLIQPTDVVNDNVDLSSLHRVPFNEIKEKSIIGPKDIIVKSKTSKPVFFMVEETNKMIAVTDQFHIVHIISDEILPEYLLWYLRSNKVQKYLRSMMYGTSVKFIKMSTLIEMIIPIPTIIDQERIIQMNQLMKTEEQLVTEIIGLKKQIIEQTSMNIVEGV